MNHLWHSTVFAVAAALLTLAFRRNHAQVRYWLWFSASLKFLIPISLLIGLGSHLYQPPAAGRTVTTAASLAIEQVTEPFPETPSFAPAASHRREWVPFVMIAVWVCGLAAIVISRFRGWLRIRAAVRASVALDILAPVEIRSAPGLLEPGADVHRRNEAARAGTHAEVRSGVDQALRWRGCHRRWCQGRWRTRESRTVSR